MPETPVPVPISATALASTAAASMRRAAPVPDDTEQRPASTARSRAQPKAASWAFSTPYASANAQFVHRLPVMALSCPRSDATVTVSAARGNPQMGPGVEKGGRGAQSLAEAGVPVPGRHAATQDQKKRVKKMLIRS
ncbi:hypothetical protein GCM10020000_28200 [Streptomyces olivoverticillatus]